MMMDGRARGELSCDGCYKLTGNDRRAQSVAMRHAVRARSMGRAPVGGVDHDKGFDTYVPGWLYLLRPDARRGDDHRIRYGRALLLSAIRNALDRSRAALGREAEIQALRDSYVLLTRREQQVMALPPRSGNAENEGQFSSRPGDDVRQTRCAGSVEGLTLDRSSEPGSAHLGSSSSASSSAPEPIRPRTERC
jgi:hypothetical protein